MLIVNSVYFLYKQILITIHIDDYYSITSFSINMQKLDNLFSLLFFIL